MEPSKQESVSRQSSILKAPKQRQPLQCVATNSSSSESSPTTKIKRRVSFAKNKRIREFCGEVEPKEGLDDSYEEHDLSTTKSSSGNSTDHPLVITVACEDKENFPIQLFLPTDQFECKEIQAAPPSVDGDNLSQCEMEMDNSIMACQTVNTEMQNKEMILPNTTIYFDDGMDITTSVQPQIISEKVQEGDYYDDTVPVSQTYVDDVPMEITENLPSILPTKMVHAQNANHNVNFEYNSSNFSEPISTILGIGHVKKSAESQSTKLLTGNSENETECFTDVPLEFTSVIPSSTWIKPHSLCPNKDETERLNCKTMEFTEVVQVHNIIRENKPGKIDASSENTIEALVAQKDGQSNTSLKQIQHNEVDQGKNNVLCDSSIVMNEACANQNEIDQSSNVNYNLLEKVQEKAGTSSNASMKIREAVPVCNEINKLPVCMKEIQQETVQEKTKIFCNQSLELTGVSNNEIHQFKNSEIEQIQRQEKTKFFLDTSMETTEVIPNHNKIGQYIGSKNKVLNLDGNKTKVFFNTSMEMTEAVPTHHKINQPFEIEEKTHPGNIQDKTKLFDDNSMEITEAFNHNKIQQLGHCKTQFVAAGNEKTQLFFNASMEMTEAVPITNKSSKQIPTIDKTHQETTQDRTKLFFDKSMEVTEAVLHHNRISSPSKFDNQTLEPRQENTKFFFNASMEMTEGVPALLNKINQPTIDVLKIHEDVTLEKTEVYCNKSMEITEAVPACHLANQSMVGKEKSQQEVTQDRTKIFQNKSMSVTETILNYNKSNLFCKSKNQPLEQEQEKTKLFFSTSMEITETAPVVNKPHQLRSELESVKCRNIPEKTEIFQDKSMEITEAIKNIYSNNYHFEKSMEKSQTSDDLQEKTRVFPSYSMSVTETIPVDKEIWQCDIQNNEAILKQSEELCVNDRAMNQSSNLLENSKAMSKSRDEKTKFFNNKSMDFTEVLPVLEHQNVSSYIQNNVPNLITDKTKLFFNNSMDITGAVMNNPNSFSTNPSMEDLERLHQYESILPSKINIQNPITNANHSISNKDNAFNKSSYRDKSFHRMTTDELNTLCASMNLPTQNYTIERSSTLQNDFISICNDVNVLRDSLQKNIFHQNFTIAPDINIAMDNDRHSSTDVSKNSEKPDDLQIFCKSDCDSIGRSVIPCKEKSQISSTENESQKEQSAIDKHTLKEGNEISEVKSMELNMRNLIYQNVSSNLNDSLTNPIHSPIHSNDREYSNRNIFNDNKQIRGTQNDIYSLDKSEMFQTHNTSVNLSNIQKSCFKRKSTELDENPATAENSLTRLPSDNTDVLIATMGFKTKLSHPLIINDRTTIKIPRVLLDNDMLSPNSNETVSRGDNENWLKNITTSVIENEVFDEECNSSNKENESPEKKECSVRTELFPENSMNKLEEIQPPSFLCSDSFQNESMADAQILDNRPTDVLSSGIIQDQINVIFEKQCCRENNDSSNSEDSNTNEMRHSFQKDFSSTNNMDGVDTVRPLNNENSESVGQPVFFNNSKDVNESMISLINEENVNTDPLAPFLSLTKSIETYEKRDDCIWAIRKIDQKTVAVDFISKSFVTIIRLNEIEKACIRDIDNIEFISRLHCGSKNILLKIVHRLLLSKLKTDKLLSEYKMYEDVLPLLTCISNEVILVMDFMFDMERLSALNILSVESERVLFMVSSKKANIILEISLLLKIFNEIGPDDIEVTCVLGDIRINDIKQLIINIKKDSTFLSRYINDVKDYIMLMEESTHMQR